MSLTVATTAKPCHYCGSYHSTICPRVEEIEYHQDGSVKRVRLRGLDTPEALAGPDTPADSHSWNQPLAKLEDGKWVDPFVPADSQEDKT